MKFRLLAATACVLTLAACGPHHATTPEKPSAAKVVDYGQDGITLQKASDVDKLIGAPADFKTFIAGVVTKQTAGSDPSSQCAPSVGVNVIDPAGFASGGISDCGGAAIIWAKKDGAWKQLWGGQMQPDCEAMKAAGVPKVIEAAAGDGCFDKTQNKVVPYEP